MDKTLLFFVLISAFLYLAGCNSEDERLAEFAETSVEQQARQNAALAKATDDIHQERTSLDKQQDVLEEDRREVASQRLRDPLIANAIQAMGIILACLAPLLICVYALKQAGSASPEQELGTMLVEELASPDSQLLPPLAPALNKLNTSDEATPTLLQSIDSAAESARRP